MTTNHLDRLDPALIRPGRVDLILNVGPATEHQCRRMFLKFFPDDDARAERFVDAVRAGGVELSMALLQSYFMQVRGGTGDACRRACMHARGTPAGRRACMPAAQGT